MRTPEELTDRFRSAGRKMTPQRQAVFRALSGNSAHPTAEVVWDHVRVTMPTVSLRTVYQVLNDLVDLGEIQAVDVGTGPVRFDPNTGRHDHFVCTRCRKVLDVHAEVPAELASTRYPGYEVEAAEIVFRGRCPQCVRVENHR